ncbi:hypothetical protein, partial [Listeria ivanovii]|uniref:hypothetical protein n=2 Tax=Listeria ivanovii TaxID=1638 RepID=UPI000DB286F2
KDNYYKKERWEMFGMQKNVLGLSLFCEEILYISKLFNDGNSLEMVEERIHALFSPQKSRVLYERIAFLKYDFVSEIKTEQNLVLKYICFYLIMRTDKCLMAFLHFFYHEYLLLYDVNLERNQLLRFLLGETTWSLKKLERQCDLYIKLLLEAEMIVKQGNQFIWEKHYFDISEEKMIRQSTNNFFKNLILGEQLICG